MSYQWQREQLLGIMKSCISSEVLLPLSITNLTLTLFFGNLLHQYFQYKRIEFRFFLHKSVYRCFLTASKPGDRVCFKIRSNSFLVSPQESAPLRLLSALLNGLVFLQLRVNAFGGKLDQTWICFWNCLRAALCCGGSCGWD